MKLDNEFFWSLTPSEFSLLVDRHREAESMKDYRAGIIAVILAESNRDKKKQKNPFTVADFFPSLQQVKKEKKRKTDEELYNIAQQITKVLGN
jgi:hypothetical protein